MRDDDPYDDWFEPDPDEPRRRPEPMRRARSQRPGTTAGRQPVLVAAAAVLGLIVLVVVIIVSALGDDGGTAAEEVPPAVTGEIVPEETAEPVETETAPPAETETEAAPPPPDTSALPATGTLRLGDEGPEVQALQEALAELGFEVGTPDGTFGQQTADAVRAFQEQAGLSADGIAGAETLAAIRNALAAREG